MTAEELFRDFEAGFAKRKFLRVCWLPLSIFSSS